MARFRLRFLFQEFDLSGPSITIGRSPDCYITIDDPLVSREHARIEVADGVACVVDLGSRNGVAVNGHRIDEPRALEEGDRIRLGSQELVFHVVSKGKRRSPPTGALVYCRACGTPYPEHVQCPHCGATEPRTMDDDTASARLVESRATWAFELLADVIDRAIETGRQTQAVRLLDQAAREMEHRLERGHTVRPEHVERIAALAVHVSVASGDEQWLDWALELYRRRGQLPGEELVGRLEELVRSRPTGVSEKVVEFARWCREARGEKPPPDVFERLDAIVRGRP